MACFQRRGGRWLPLTGRLHRRRPDLSKVLLHPDCADYVSTLLMTPPAMPSDYAVGTANSGSWAFEPLSNALAPAAGMEAVGARRPLNA